jgi:hypothetical protein
MGLLSNIFSATGVEDAYADPGTIYQDVLSEKGAVGNLGELDVPGVADAAVGQGGVVNELTAGDGLGVDHILTSDSLGPVLDPEG